MELTMKDLPDKALDQIAAYFQALSEPTRLKILNLLREHERNVGDFAQLSGYSAANVSDRVGDAPIYAL